MKLIASSHVTCPYVQNPTNCLCCSFSTALQYAPCIGDPRSANSLTSPVSLFKNVTQMRLSLKVLSNDSFTISVYRADLGQVYVLLASYKFDSGKGPLLFDICLPAGTYAVVVVVKPASSTSMHDQPLFTVTSLMAVSVSASCSRSASSNATGEND